MTVESVSKRNRMAAGSSGKSLWRYVAVIVACAAALASCELLRRSGVQIPSDVFLPAHVLLEFSSIVVSFAVFATGWFGYGQTRNTRDLLLGIVFLATGAIDFIHTFTYTGMPDFIGATGVGNATAFWMIARLTSAIGLLCASFVVTKSQSKLLSRGFLLGAAVVYTAGVVGLVIHFSPASGRLFYNHGLTPFKIGLEYVVIALYAVSFVLVSRKRGWDPGVIAPLRSALLVAMFAELAFTLYISPYSTMNFLGHVFKTTAYYLILGALFVSSVRRPYEGLSEATEELQAMYADAQAHRREIEQSFGRIGSALSSSIRLDEAVERIADLVVDMLHADCAVVMSLAKFGDRDRVAAQRGTCHEPEWPLDVAVEISKMAVDQDKTILNNDLGASGLICCSYDRETCLRSVVCAPMIYEGETLGVIAVYSHRPDAFEEGDAKLIEAFASHAAVATHNAISYEHESRIADVLQRSLLTPATLVIDGFEIAQVYASATEEALVGGDFYDVLELGEHRIAVVIGDVSGKGLSAAVHTALAKYALRAYLVEGHSPAAAMALLSRTIDKSTGIETFVTVFCGVLDTRTGHMLWASAGHEPALYLRDDRCVELSATGPALGIALGDSYEEGELTFETGSVLLMYTDGVSEARRKGVMFGTERIGEELAACREKGSEDIARCVHQSVLDFAGGDIRDDVAILAVKARE